MLKIRLQRIGRRNNPSYRIVVVDSRVAARKGKPVEVLGVYDTIRSTTSIDKDRVVHWISKGAQVSDTMHNILIVNGVIQGVKKNVLPKKHPVRKEGDNKDNAGAATGDTGSDSSADASAADEASAPASDSDTVVDSSSPDTAANSSGDADAQVPESSASSQPDTPESAAPDINSQPDTPQSEDSAPSVETPAPQDIHKNPSDEG